MAKQIEIRPEIAVAFMRDLRAYHATKDGDKRTLIAARQAEQLSRHWKATVRLAEIRELFERMKGAETKKPAPGFVPGAG
jgi:hypothetical protein